jgi:hypothetical protein
MKPMKFVIEIHHPERPAEVCARFETHTNPLMAIHPGDVLHPDHWPGNPPVEGELVVMRIEHVIGEDITALSHRIIVYTDRPSNSL